MIVILNINTYSTEGEGRTKVFYKVYDNSVTGVVIGNRAIIKESGFQFYVDDFIAEQLHKLNFYFDEFTPKLKVRDGETIFVPSENDEFLKRKEIEELENRLHSLKK